MRHALMQSTSQHLQDTDAQQGMDPQSNTNSPLSPYTGGPPVVPSPPPAASGVRRHVSLTYGAAGGARSKLASSGLKRSGTLQATLPTHAASPSDSTSGAAGEEEQFEYTVDDAGAYEDEYYGKGQYGGPISPIGRTSPWSSGNDWRTPGGGSGFSSSGGNNGNTNIAIDDVQRALSALEIASNNGGASNAMYAGGYQPGGQSVHPPRFNPSHPPPAQAPGMRSNVPGNNNGNGNGGSKLQLVTDFEGRKTPLSQAAYQQQQQYLAQQQYQNQGGQGNNSGTASWEPKDRVLGGRASNPNLQYGYRQGGQHSKSLSSSSAGSGGGGGGMPSGPVPNVPAIPQQYLQQQQQPRLGVATSFGGQQGGAGQQAQGQGTTSGQTPTTAFANTPIDVPSLIATKGYNPTAFDVRPTFVGLIYTVVRGNVITDCCASRLDSS